MSDANPIARNIQEIHERISKAAERSGRPAENIRLIAVSKTYPIADVKIAAEAGITDAGENRIQEALPKIQALAQSTSVPRLSWHLIGHLQSNKARLAVENFDLIHSVDSVKLAEELNKVAQASRLRNPQQILLQISVSGEESKYGIPPDQAEPVIQSILQNCPHIKIQGLMTMAPFSDDPEQSRPHFAALRKLSETLRRSLPALNAPHLSMGMTGDYETAVEEGATLLRVGTAIFGRRN